MRPRVLVLCGLSLHWLLQLICFWVWTCYARYYCWHLVLTIWIQNLMCMVVKEHSLAEGRVVQCTFCGCLRLLEICTTLRILTQNFRCSLKTVLRRPRLCCVPYHVLWNTVNTWGFLFSWYWYKTVLLCTSFIEPSFAVVNVACTVPSFVKLYYCCLKSLVLTILVQTTIVHLVIIGHGLTEVNVSCTVPGFVK